MHIYVDLGRAEKVRRDKENNDDLMSVRAMSVKSNMSGV
jgi:hypothetical protein